jgi:hypothetical protein
VTRGYFHKRYIFPTKDNIEECIDDFLSKGEIMILKSPLSREELIELVKTLHGLNNFEYSRITLWITGGIVKTFSIYMD